MDCRDPEQTRVSAGSVVLLGLFELLKGHTDQAAVIEAVRRCLGLMLQLLAAGERSLQRKARLDGLADTSCRLRSKAAAC